MCFSIPAQKITKQKTELFDKFVSCKLCLLTYSYTSSTRNMKRHAEVCEGFNPKQKHLTTSKESNMLELKYESTSSSTPSSITSSSLPVVRKTNPSSHKRKMKNLLAQWVCSNAHPISIVQDSGFKEIVDEVIRIGNSEFQSTIKVQIIFVNFI